MADQRTLRVVIVGNASQAQRALRDLGRDADQLQRRTGGMSGGFAAFGGKLAAFGRTAVAGFGLAAGAAAVWGVKTASNMEQSEIAFTTMLGSSKKAMAFLSQLKQFAIKTPFSTEDVVSYSQSLMAMGFKAKEVIPILTHTGDAVAGLGGSPEKLQRVLLAIGQIKAKGKVMASEMLQLTENGISGWQMIADHLHKTVPEVMKMSEQGAISADTAISALMGGMQNKFGGMMKNQSTTVAGMWSTMKDTVQLALGDMMRAFFPLIKSVLPKITAGASAMASALVPAFQRIGAAVSPAVSMIRAGFSSHVLPVLRQVGAFISASILPTLRSIGIQTIPPLMQIAGVLRGSVIPLFQALISAALPVWHTIASVVTGTVMPAITGLISAVMPRFQQFVNFLRTTIVPVLSGMFKQAQPVIQQLGSTISTVMQGIGVAINVLAPVLQVLWKFLGPIVIGTLKGLWSGILGVIKGALNIIQGVVKIFIGIFTGNWSKVWSGVKQIFTGVWQFIVGAFKIYIYGTIVGILRGGVARLLGLWRGGWTAIRGAFTSVINFIRGGISSWIGGIRSVISGGVNFIRRIWSIGWNGIKAAIQLHARIILQIARELPTRIRGFFTSLPGKLREIGRNIIDGLINGIRGAWHKVTAVVSGLVDMIPGPIRKALGIHSPSRVMRDIGRWITEGLVKGMLGGTKKVEATSKKLHQLVTKAFDAGKLSRRGNSILHKWLHKENTQLWRMAKMRENVAAKLKAANDKLAGLKKSKAEMASGIAGKAKDFGSVLGVFDSAEYGDNSASAMLARLKGKLNTIVKFRKNLARLKKRGLGIGIINEIAQAGPEQGGDMAQALLNADKGQISQLNSTYKAIGVQSNALGNSVASDYYNAGIKATEGLIKGLKSKESMLTKAITNMSKAMVRSLKRALGIKSPSRVFAELGSFTAAGFTAGLIAGEGDVQKAVNELAGTRPTGRLANRSIAREATFHAGNGGHTAPVVHVTVQGNVTSERALARSLATTIRDEIVRNGKRNGGRTGL